MADVLHYGTIRSCHLLKQFSLKTQNDNNSFTNLLILTDHSSAFEETF